VFCPFFDKLQPHDANYNGGNTNLGNLLWDNMHSCVTTSDKSCKTNKTHSAQNIAYIFPSIDHMRPCAQKIPAYIHFLFCLIYGFTFFMTSFAMWTTPGI
jgi:hypothetical protein